MKDRNEVENDNVFEVIEDWFINVVVVDVVEITLKVLELEVVVHVEEVVDAVLVDEPKLKVLSDWCVDVIEAEFEIIE